MSNIADDPSLGADEVRQRAAAGAGLVTLQGLAVRALAFLGNIVLARLLVPEDFGVLAFGLTLMVLANSLSDGGIGAALIRRNEPVHRDDLRAFLAFQLIVLVGAVGLTGAIGSFVGETGLLVTVMVLSLPIFAFRSPGLITLERALQYRRVVIVELADTVAFYAWSIATAAVGWGVWSVVTGVIVRSVVGTATMAAVSPVGMPLPRWSWARIRSRLSFGARFQAAWLATVAREQGVNIGTTAIAGLSTLGLWSLANRVLSVPGTMFTSLARVSFPAISRLLGTGEKPGPLIERNVGRLVIAAGFVLAALVGSAPAAIPVVFGSDWEGAVEAIPWASLALLISAPISVVGGSYLYAAGDASTPLRAAVLNTVAFWGVAFALLPTFGLAALGLGWLASGLVDALMIGIAVSRQTGARLLRPVLVPTTLTAAAAGCGWWISLELGDTFASAVAGGSTALLVCFVLLGSFCRESLKDSLSAIRRIARASRLREQLA